MKRRRKFSANTCANFDIVTILSCCGCCCCCCLSMESMPIDKMAQLKSRIFVWKSEIRKYFFKFINFLLFFLTLLCGDYLLLKRFNYFNLITVCCDSLVSLQHPTDYDNDTNVDSCVLPPDRCNNIVKHYINIIVVVVVIFLSCYYCCCALVHHLPQISTKICSIPSYFSSSSSSSSSSFANRFMTKFCHKQQNFRNLNKFSILFPLKIPFFSLILCWSFCFTQCSEYLGTTTVSHNFTTTPNYASILNFITPITLTTTPATKLANGNITETVDAFINNAIDGPKSLRLSLQKPEIPATTTTTTAAYSANIYQNSSVVSSKFTFSSSFIITTTKKPNKFFRHGSVPFLSVILSSKRETPISGGASFSSLSHAESSHFPLITKERRKRRKQMQIVYKQSDKNANSSSISFSQSTLDVDDRLSKSATSAGHDRLLTGLSDVMLSDGNGEEDADNSDGVVIENDHDETDENEDAAGIATGTEEGNFDTGNQRKKNTRDSKSKKNVNIEDDEDYDEDGESYASHISGSVFYNNNNNNNGNGANNGVDNVDYVMHSPRTVSTKYGALQGIVITFVRYNDSSTSSSSSSTSITLSPVEAFLGVPYASSPAGNLRFMPPVAPVHWRGVRQANHLAPVCPQRLPALNVSALTKSNSDSVSASVDHDEPPSSNRNTSNRYIDRLHRQLPYLRNQSEDCLYLNIYVPFEQYHKQRQQFQQQQKQRKKFDAKDNNQNNFQSKSTSQHGKSRRQYPVIVFINGDSYDSGTGNSYDASVWSSYGQVIVVTLNYRLGVLGFLPAQVDGAVRGNYGLMDQVAALHWIQENIAEFGGNFDNVTVIGHGFGASCLHLLMLSPMAKGLFSRAVLMSGSALAPAAIARDAENYARILAKELNCPVYDNVQLVDCLKRKSVDELLSVDLQPFRYLSAFGPIVDGIVVPYEPKVMMETMVYGGYQKSSTNNHPHHHHGGSGKQSGSGATTSSGGYGSYSQVNFDGDILFGVSRVEPPPATFSVHDEQFGIDVERRNRILRTLVRNLFDYHQQTIFWTLINEYTDWSRPSEHPINLLDSTVEILTDALVLGPLTESIELFFRSIQRHAEISKDSKVFNSYSARPTTPSSSPTNQFDFAYQDPNHDSSSHHSTRNRMFFYVFQNQNEENNKRQSINQRLGSMHGEELDYLFGAPIADQVTGHTIGHFTSNLTRPNDLALSEAFITYFTNFAKYGNPNFDSDSKTSSSVGNKKVDSGSTISTASPNSNEQQLRARYEQLNWPSYSIGQRRYLLIGSKPRVRDHYNAHRLSFWLNLIPRLLMDQFAKRPESPNEVDDLLMDSFDDKDDIGLRYIRHHLLDNYDNSDSYEGQVRQITFGTLAQQQGPGRMKSSGGSLLRTSASSGSLFQMNADQSSSRNSNDSSGFSFIGNIGGKSVKIKTNLNGGSISGNGGGGGGVSGSGNSSASGSIGENGSQGDGANYSTALSVTIAIGGSLLILNMLIFTGVYYQLNRHAEKNRQRNLQQQQQQQLLQSHGTNSTMAHYHSSGSSAMTTNNSSNQIYCPSSSGTMTTSNSISNNNNNCSNVMTIDNSNVVIDPSNHQTSTNNAANYLHYNASLANGSLQTEQQMLAAVLNQSTIMGQLDVTGAMVVGGGGGDYGYSTGAGQLVKGTNSSSSSSAGPSHVHHVHYLDQDHQTAGVSSGGGESTGTMQRQRHHHHHHHMMMLNPDGSTSAPSTTNNTTSNDQTVTGLEIDSSQQLLDYYPLHSFNDSNNNTNNGVVSQTVSDEANTIFVNDPHRHHTQHTPKANKTLRFSLSNEVMADHHHSLHPQPNTVQSSSLSSFSPTSGSGDSTECSTTTTNSSALKRVKI